MKVAFHGAVIYEYIARKHACLLRLIGIEVGKLIVFKFCYSFGFNSFTASDNTF